MLGTFSVGSAIDATRRASSRSEYAVERHRHRRYFSSHVHSLFLLLALTILLHRLQPVKYGKNDIALSASCTLAPRFSNYLPAPIITRNNPLVS